MGRLTRLAFWLGYLTTSGGLALGALALAGYASPSGLAGGASMALFGMVTLSLAVAVRDVTPGARP